MRKHSGAAIAVVKISETSLGRPPHGSNGNHFDVYLSLLWATTSWLGPC